MKEGVQIHGRNNVRFLFIHAGDKCHDQRIKAVQLIEKAVNSDMKKYLLLLYSSAANLLSFAGYTTNSIYTALIEQNQKQLI